MKNRKVSIIGCGFVGSTTAYTLMLTGVASEIVIVDVNKTKAEGDVLDMNHGMSFTNPVEIVAGDYADCIDSHVIIITAGVGQKDGETRTDLLKRNIKVFDSILDNLMPYIGDETILLVVTNPVDVLTYYTKIKTGLPFERVIGSGTVLDTARLKYALSEETNVDPRNVHTFVIGEHGDSEVAALSVTQVGGLSIHGFCKLCNKCEDLNCTNIDRLGSLIKNSAYEIIEKKGATYYAVALAVNRIVETIILDQHSVLTVSTLINQKYDINDVYLSLPCVVGAKGVEKIIEPNYSKEEIKKLQLSANIIKKNIQEIL